MKFNIFKRLNLIEAGIKDYSKVLDDNKRILEEMWENNVLSEEDEKYNEWRIKEYRRLDDDATTKLKSFVKKMIEAIKNNPESKYIKESEKGNYSKEDYLQGKVKGFTSVSGKTVWDYIQDYERQYWSTFSFFKKYITEYETLEKFEKENKVIHETVSIENPIREVFKESYLGKKIGNIPYTPSLMRGYNPNDLDEFIMDIEPVLKIFGEILKKGRWTRYHKSGKRVGESSSYWENAEGETLRLSNHELPDTAKRRYERDTGLTSGWDYEYVVDDNRTLFKYYIQDSLQDIKELFIKDSGLDI